MANGISVRHFFLRFALDCGRLDFGDDEMKTLGYYNGQIGEFDSLSVPMGDRSHFFGDGVYDATYSRNYKIYDLDEHVDRLYNSARLLEIEISETKNEMKQILSELVRKMDTGENFVYFQVTRGSGPRNHLFPESKKTNLLVSISHKEIADVYEKIDLITMPDTRFFHCNIKTLNLIPAVMASQAAKEKGCAEAVLHRDGRVTECAHSNVHIIKDGVFKTAPTDNLILAGITRKHLIENCKALGIPVLEEPFTVEEMMDADEVIVSSVGTLCLSAKTIDGKAVGGKAPKLLKVLQDKMLEDFIEKTK